jgi:hypothetical protein
MELYLVKSSGTDEWGGIYWENLQIFNDLKLARKFAAKVKKLIRADKSTDEVEMENFTLRTEEV